MSQNLYQLRINCNGLRTDWISDRKKNLYTFITTSNRSGKNWLILSIIHEDLSIHLDLCKRKPDTS